MLNHLAAMELGDIKSVGVANLNRLQLDSTKRTQVLSFNMQIFIVSGNRIGGVDKYNLHMYLPFSLSLSL